MKKIEASPRFEAHDLPTPRLRQGKNELGNLFKYSEQVVCPPSYKSKLTI